MGLNRLIFCLLGVTARIFSPLCVHRFFLMNSCNFSCCELFRVRVPFYDFLYLYFKVVFVGHMQDCNSYIFFVCKGYCN
jgi:hypothetical protein